MNESAHTPAKSKILLVESHKKESVIIQPHLPAGDFDLVAVDGIELAVNAVLSGKPDLIFVSAEFASAGEKLEQLKQASRQCGSTLVLLSGGESNVDAAQYDDVVRTDTGNTELAHRLGNLVELKRARLELEWMKQRLKNDRKLLTKYFSEDIVEGILQDEHANSLSGRHQEATIMFFDVRRSTTIAENLEPQIFAEFLSEFFTDIMDLVYGNHGSVNKLLGDGIMSTFGCPVPTEHDVLNAAKCALQIRNHPGDL
jgi:adenylate cyclase